MFKRILSLILIINLFLITSASLLLPINAAAEDAAEKSESKSEDGIEDMASFKCIYDTEAKRIKASGTLDNSVFADHRHWKLAVYAVPPGMSEYDVIAHSDAAPLAEINASIKFEFSFKVDEISDRYSRYALFLRSPENEFLLTTEAQYPEVASLFEHSSDKLAYKGISAEFSSSITDINPGSAIIPIYWDELFSKTPSSMFYVVESRQYFFEKALIDELDSAMRSMTMSGTKIYLRLLKTAPSDAGGAEYVMPDIYDRETLMQVHAAISFFANRYSNQNSGILTGFIVGKGWNAPEKYNYAGGVALDEYTDRCGLYAIVIANAARSVNPKLDIALPIDGSEFARSAEGEQENFSKRFIRRLLAYFDASFYSGIKLSFAVDADVAPLGITNDSVKSGIDLGYANEAQQFYAGAHRSFSDFITLLSREYESCPEKYLYSWTPEKNLSGTALAAAYVYSYYSLFSDSRVFAFSVDLCNNTSGLAELAHVLKYIDTDKGADSLKAIATLFGKNDWSDIFSAFDIVKTRTKTLVHSKGQIDSNLEYYGTFPYFAFANSNLIEGWYSGVSCDGIKIDYAENSDKSLRAYFSQWGTDSFGELQYIFGYPENMIYTPILRFDLRITDNRENSLYEVKLILDSDKQRYEGSCIIDGNKTVAVDFDISQFVKSNMVESLRICVRALDASDADCSLWLYDIQGCSNAYPSDTLAELISSARDKMRNPDEEKTESQYIGKVALAVGIIVLTAGLGAVLILGFRRDDKASKTRDDSFR